MSARPFPESVLVVDDAEFMVRVLEEMFASAGYAVRAARSGPEAKRTILRMSTTHTQ